MAAAIDTTIIYRRISTFRYNNSTYLQNYSLVCTRCRALNGKSSRLLHDMSSLPFQPRVSKLQGYFLRNHLNWKFTKIYANSPREHDTDSAEKPETTGPESPKKPTGAASSSGRREKQGKNSWWGNDSNKWKWQPIIQAQEMGVLLIQLGIVMFVMRLLRPGIPLPGSEPRTPTTFVSVPYSDFVSKINGNQVQKVEVDGVHIMFKLKRESGSVDNGVGEVNSKFQDSDSLLKTVTPTKRVVYTTTRPIDIKTPYEKMLENDVEFGSPDKRSGGFLNSALVSCCWI